MLKYSEMTIDDYEQSYDLWKKTEGLVLSDADSRASIQAYLERNPGQSFVCRLDNEIIGTILCGQDGRRGYIYHVAVSMDHRGKGIGTELVQRSLSKLSEHGIMKCHIFVVEDNEVGNGFWSHSGWIRRHGILIYSRETK
jgi:ribosomal protein S18 acetylase RimI-like enzyme